MQKNGTFDISNLYNKNPIPLKVHYLMIQISHTIRQMLQKGSIEIKERIQHMKQELISTIINLAVHTKIQLRFD